MRWITLSAALMLLVSLTAPAHAQKAKKINSPAELMPAGTLAYAEVQDMKQLAKEVRGLFKGSYLFNVPNSLNRLKKKIKDAGPVDLEELQAAGLVLSPEVARELGRMKGAAVGLTSFGFGPGNPEPDFLAVVLPGSSNAPGFAMRALMTMGQVKVVATVGKVKIYQHYRRFGVGKKAPAFKDAPIPRDGGECFPAYPQEDRPDIDSRFFGPAFAKMPGVILLGTPNAVKQAIWRAKGKADGPSLAESKSFQAVNKKVGGKPGLVGFINVPEAIKLGKRAGQKVGPEAREMFTKLDKLINFKAFKGYGVSIILDEGTLGYRELVLLDKNEESIIRDLVPTKAVNTKLLNYAPTDSFLAMAMTMADGQKRWNALLKVYDAVFPPQLFDGKSFSEMIQGVEQKLGAKIGEDILANMTDVGFVLGDLLDMKVKRVEVVGDNYHRISMQPQIPMYLIVQAKDKKAVSKLTKVLQNACGMAARQPIKPKMKKVNGQTIYSLRIDEDYSVDYAVHGNTILVGPYGEPIAQAIKTAKANKGLLSHAKVAGRIQKVSDSPAIMMAKPGAIMAAFVGTAVWAFRGAAKHEDATKAAPAIPPKEKRDRPKDQCAPIQPDGKQKEVNKTVTYVKETEQVKKLKKMIAPILEQERWFILSVEVGDDYVMGVGELPGFRKTVANWTDFVIELLPRRHIAHPPGAESGPEIELKKDGLTTESKKLKR